jgi:hypothetical protein
MPFQYAHQIYRFASQCKVHSGPKESNGCMSNILKNIKSKVCSVFKKSFCSVTTETPLKSEVDWRWENKLAHWICAHTLHIHILHAVKSLSCKKTTLSVKTPSAWVCSRHAYRVHSHLTNQFKPLQKCTHYLFL